MIAYTKCTYRRFTNIFDPIYDLHIRSIYRLVVDVYGVHELNSMNNAKRIKLSYIANVENNAAELSILLLFELSELLDYKFNI